MISGLQTAIQKIKTSKRKLIGYTQQEVSAILALCRNDGG